MAIKAHALIHREHRFENDAGEITADITHDYAVVRELMSDLLAEGAEIEVGALSAKRSTPLPNSSPLTRR